MRLTYCDIVVDVVVRTKANRRMGGRFGYINGAIGFMCLYKAPVDYGVLITSLYLDSSMPLSQYRFCDKSYRFYLSNIYPLWQALRPIPRDWPGYYGFYYRHGSQGRVYFYHYVETGCQ